MFVKIATVKTIPERLRRSHRIDSPNDDGWLRFIRDKNEKPTSQLIDESHLLLRDDAINKMLQLPSDENVQTSTTNFLFHYGAKVLKVLSYILCFLILLAGGVISKGTLLFMTSQIKPGIQHGYCSRSDTNFLVISTWLNLWMIGFIVTVVVVIFSPRIECWCQVKPRRANLVDLGHILLLSRSGGDDAVPLPPHHLLPPR